MSRIDLCAIAVGLAMDAFAVAVAVGMTVKPVTFRHVFRLAWHFGLFQFMMPVIGWYIGSTVSVYVAAFDHWLAFGLLTLIGGKILHEARAPGGIHVSADPTGGWMLVMLSVATSIDALAVGLSMAFLRIAIWMPSAVIGLVACAFTAVGITMGTKISRRWDRAAYILGGVALLFIGLRILITHLMAS